MVEVIGERRPRARVRARIKAGHVLVAMGGLYGLPVGGVTVRNLMEVLAGREHETFEFMERQVPLETYQVGVEPRRAYGTE